MIHVCLRLLLLHFKHFAVVLIDRNPVLSEEFESHGREGLQIECFRFNQFVEEFSDLDKIENGAVRRLSFATSLAPVKEFCEVRLDWRLREEVVYDLELYL